VDQYPESRGRDHIPRYAFPCRKCGGFHSRHMRLLLRASSHVKLHRLDKDSVYSQEHEGVFVWGLTSIRIVPHIVLVGVIWVVFILCDPLIQALIAEEAITEVHISWLHLCCCKVSCRFHQSSPCSRCRFSDLPPFFDTSSPVL
jgi:hypothetical protein